MSPWPETPAVDLIALNRWERDIKVYAGEVHDIGYGDPSEARLKLMAMVGLCSEHLARIQRHEDARLDRQAREERETSCPPAIA